MLHRTSFRGVSGEISFGKGRDRSGLTEIRRFIDKDTDKHYKSVSIAIILCYYVEFSCY